MTMFFFSWWANFIPLTCKLKRHSFWTSWSIVATFIAVTLNILWPQVSTTEHVNTYTGLTAVIISYWPYRSLLNTYIPQTSPEHIWSHQRQPASMQIVVFFLHIWHLIKIDEVSLEKNTFGSYSRRYLQMQKYMALPLTVKANSELSCLQSQLKTNPRSSINCSFPFKFFTVIFERVNFAFDLKIQYFEEIMWSNLTSVRFLTLSHNISTEQLVQYRFDNCTGTQIETSWNGQTQKVPITSTSLAGVKSVVMYPRIQYCGQSCLTFYQL